MSELSAVLREHADAEIKHKHKLLGTAGYSRAAADEIDLLERCLGIAAGYISSTDGYKHMHPDQVVAMLRRMVVEGDERDD